jgi:hypothetical protein
MDAHSSYFPTHQPQSQPQPQPQQQQQQQRQQQRRTEVVPPAPVQPVQVQAEVEPEEFVGAAQVRSSSILFRKHGASDRVFPDQPSITKRPPSPASSLPNPYPTYPSVKGARTASATSSTLASSTSNNTSPESPPYPAIRLAVYEQLLSLPHSQVNPNAKLGSYLSQTQPPQTPPAGLHANVHTAGWGAMYFSPHTPTTGATATTTTTTAKQGRQLLPPPPLPTAPRPGSYWSPHREDVGADVAIEEPEEIDNDEIEGTDPQRESLSRSAGTPSLGATLTARSSTSPRSTHPAIVGGLEGLGRCLGLGRRRRRRGRRRGRSGFNWLRFGAILDARADCCIYLHVSPLTPHAHVDLHATRAQANVIFRAVYYTCA